MAEPNTPTDIPELAELRKPPKVFTLPEPKPLTGLSTELGRVPGTSVPTDYQQATKQYKTPKDASIAQVGLLQRQSELERDVEIARQAKEQYAAETEAAIATQKREERQRVQQNLEAVRAQFPRPQMHPTKDNVQSLSTLFGLIGVVGMAMGGAGKQSATAALNAMGGMMKGWQQGRADLWKKEMQEFDKEMARIKAILEDAYKDAEQAEKSIISNADEARALAQVAQAKLGGQVGKQILEIKGIIPFKEHLSNIKQDLNEADKRAFEREKFGAEQAQRERQFKLTERRLDMQEKAQRFKEQKESQGGGELPKDRQTKEEYQARYQVVKNIEDIESLLEDPKYSKLITPATKFTPDVLNNLRENFPELSQKLARIQAIEFKIGGKNLTAKEQEILSPIYGWKGLTVDALRSRIKGVKDDFNETNQLTELYYPGLKRIHSDWDKYYESKGAIPSVPETGGSAPAVEPEIKKPDVGDIKNGYRYLGGDPSKESNWEKVR